MSITSPYWRLDAACRTADPDLFFGPWNESQHERTARESRARDICGGCPSRTLCLEYALRLGLRWGVWGGLGEEERQQLRTPLEVVRLCGNGRHLMDKRNTYVNPSGGKVCRACRNESERRVRAQRKEAA